MTEVRTLPLAALQHGRRSEKWAGAGPGVISATIAEMDVELAPPVAAALRAALDRHDLGYVPARTPRLAEAFAGFARRRLGWSVDPEQVTLLPDVMVGVVQLCRALAGPAGRIAFAAPNYPPFFVELRDLDADQVALRPDGSLDLAALRAALEGGARVFVLTSPHNPLGRCLPREELEAIAEVCAEHGAWVVADEIHAPLVLPGAEHVPWLEVSDAARERGVALTSASKAFNTPALKCAMAVTASAAARDAVARLGDETDHVGLLGVVAAEAAFTEGDAWLDALLALLDANRARLGRRLAADLPRVRWRPPDASFVAWLDCRGLGLGDDPAAAFLRDGAVALGRGLDYGAPGAGFVRLNFGTSPEILEEIVGRMRAAAP